MVDLHRSPLHDRHVAAGAKLAEFAGWQMPLEYAHGGVVREHVAVRSAVGVFDVSHLGKLTVRGPGARGFVNRRLTNDLGRIQAGQAQYTLCCDAASGGVVDDLIAYLFADDHVLLVPNAANAAEVARRLQAEAEAGITVTDEHEAYAILAVQGPRSAALLDRLGLPVGHDYMSFRPAAHAGERLVVCRTGYTGEHGYELVVGWSAAAALWDALLDAGGDLGVLPVGLGARDTLRTEMGYPLHGHDLSLDITPVQARVSWAVGWKKPEFWGRAALLAERAAGPRRSSWGLLAVDRAIPRPHMAVRPPDGAVPGGAVHGGAVHGGAVLGEVTSGTFSPTRRVGIGLALLASSAGIAEGGEVEVDVRGRPARMQVVRPPFVRSSVR